MPLESQGGVHSIIAADERLPSGLARSLLNVVFCGQRADRENMSEIAAGATMPNLEDEQSRVCQSHGAVVNRPSGETKLGIALQTAGQLPLNALRHPEEHGTCGWYIWWGDTLNEDPEFFQPLHVRHLAVRCPELLPFIALPPGWRVQLAPGHEDVWYDETLLAV